MVRIGWSDFVIWQCSLRQRNFRIFSGKPSEGTMAYLFDIKTNKELASVRTILIEKDCSVKINMTLTTPNCPVAESLPKEVKDSIMAIKEVKNVDLNLVWEPPWNKDMMSEAAKLELNL